MMKQCFNFLYLLLGADEYVCIARPCRDHKRLFGTFQLLKSLTARDRWNNKELHVSKGRKTIEVMCLSPFKLGSHWHIYQLLDISTNLKPDGFCRVFQLLFTSIIQSVVHLGFKPQPPFQHY